MMFSWAYYFILLSEVPGLGVLTVPSKKCFFDPSFLTNYGLNGCYFRYFSLLPCPLWFLSFSPAPSFCGVFWRCFSSFFVFVLLMEMVSPKFSITSFDVCEAPTFWTAFAVFEFPPISWCFEGGFIPASAYALPLLLLRCASSP